MFCVLSSKNRGLQQQGGGGGGGGGQCGSMKLEKRWQKRTKGTLSCCHCVGASCWLTGRGVVLLWARVWASWGVVVGEVEAFSSDRDLGA